MTYQPAPSPVRPAVDAADRPHPPCAGLFGAAMPEEERGEERTRRTGRESRQ